MFANLTKLSTILLVASAASMFSLAANAETKPLDDRFNDAYFTHGKNAFFQSNFLNQANTILGFTGYPEQHINRDASAVHDLYEEGMAKQSSMGERIMTRDLVNPYDTSIRENPSYSAIE